MDYLNEYFSNFSEAHKVEVDYLIDFDIALFSKRLVVTLKRGDTKARTIFLFPKDGAPDLVHLEPRLEVLYNELVKKEEAANND